jgi:hypothetical protein
MSGKVARVERLVNAQFMGFDRQHDRVHVFIAFGQSSKTGRSVGAFVLTAIFPPDYLFGW